jgi:hypothetical protein
MGERDDISDEELRERVIFALLAPAARIARSFGVPLQKLKGWVETAYYRETQRPEKLTLKDISHLMDVSSSKVSLLSREYRENFMSPEVEARLPRRIEFMLWAEPLSLARLKQVLTDEEPEDVESAVRELVSQERIRPRADGRTKTYELNIETSRRAWETWLARIDGLNNALDNVTDAVFARFFEGDPSAFARTLTFRMNPGARERLRAFYEDQLFPFIQQLDSEVEDEDEARSTSLSVFWAPHEYLFSWIKGEESS